MERNSLVKDNDEIEIDLRELLTALKRRLWLIVLALLLGGGAAGAYSKLVLTPQYTSTAMLYVLSKETTLTSLADLQIGSQLTTDYRIIMTSRPVLQNVIDSLGLEMSYRMLRSKLSIDNPTESRILTVTVKDPDPRLAKMIVDEVAYTASDYIGDIMEMVPPKMIEEGEIVPVPVSPNNRKNTLLGAIAGAALVCGLTFLEVILNDTIRTDEDVAKYLGLTVLASVPEREGEDKDPGKYKKEKKRSRRKKG
ncbi:MAG: polysaccharide export protein [Lachnospiraceae bacterium]|nr:polysaccharide export protein [Lachnospiraceae bacterium]